MIRTLIWSVQIKVLDSKGVIHIKHEFELAATKRERKMCWYPPKVVQCMVMAAAIECLHGCPGSRVPTFGG